MRKLLSYITPFCVILLLCIGVVWAVTIDTFEGETITDAATIEGVDTTDTP